MVVNKHPLVSICVRCYNAEKYIERCALSVFNQTYDNCEFIFVDDCSTDNTIIRIEQLSETVSNVRNKLKIVRRLENGGQASAFNTVLDTIKGDFFILVDSDDYISTNAVEKLIEKQIEDDYDIIIFDMKEIFKSYSYVRPIPEIKNSKHFSMLLLSRKIRWCICGELIRTSLITENQIRCLEGVNMAEDYTITTRTSYFAKRIGILRKVLYFYDNTNDNAITSKFNPDLLHQDDKSLMFVKEFYADKGDDYLSAWLTGWSYDLVRSIIILEKSAGGHNDFYKERCKLLDDLPNSECIHALSIPYRMVYYMRHYRCLLSFYIKTTVKIKHLKEKISKH